MVLESCSITDAKQGIWGATDMNEIRKDMVRRWFMYVTNFLWWELAGSIIGQGVRYMFASEFEHQWQSRLTVCEESKFLQKLPLEILFKEYHWTEISIIKWIRK